MKKIVVNVLIILYFLVAVVVTYALLSYNKYNIVETKDKYILTIKEDNPDFKKSDLLVVKKSQDLKEKDYVFYYDTYATKVTVKYAKIINVCRTSKLFFQPHGRGISELFPPLQRVLLNKIKEVKYESYY